MREGITVECVGCHKKKVLSFEEARVQFNDLDMPFCDTCYLPMVAVSATAKLGKRKAIAQAQANLQQPVTQRKWTDFPAYKETKLGKRRAHKK